MAKIKKYYIKGTVVPFEEDQTHEFKGHRNLSEDEVPPWSVQTGTNRRSRAPVSRVLNAFLNTEIGGTVYLGILDNGTVRGMNLTNYEKDHVVASFYDLMTRYNPPVEKHRHRIKFTPVVEKNTPDDEIAKITSYDSSQYVDPGSRMRPHQVRTYNYCWCNKDAVARFNVGTISASYVIEIHIKPWDPEHKDNRYAVGRMKTAPIHEEEYGKVFFRRQGSIVQYTAREIANMSKQRVQEHYKEKIERLKKEFHRLKQES